MNSKLSISKLDILGEVFQKHHWPIDHDKQKSYFNKYVRMLESMSEDEQNMMLELTDNFLHIKQCEYFTILSEVVCRVIANNPSVTQYFVLPAMAKDDVERLDKSSIHMLYLFKGEELEDAIDNSDIHFQVVKDKNKLSSRGIRDNEKILIVDDFIGSGKTIEESFEVHNIKDEGLKIEDVIVLSLVAHEKGVSYLKDIGVPQIFYNKLINRGISDNYIGEKKSEYVRLMNQIESRIPKLDEENRFGYCQCEALLHMHRIPNNTFPIYWLHNNISPYKR